MTATDDPRPLPPGERQAPGRGGALRDFFAGARLVGKGLRMWATSPSLMFLGVIPALIVGILYAVALVFLLLNLDALATWLTPFANGWGEPFRLATRIAAALAVVAVTLLVVIATYTALTLAIGDPFYEKIWRAVEQRLGGIPDEVDVPFWRSVRVGIGDSIRIVVFAALVGIVLFAGGFIPVVGQTLIPVLGAITAGWVLAVELTGRVFEARGISPGDRRRVLKGSRPLTLGFGITTYLLFLIPLGAIVVMPAAVAGATLLGRETLARNPLPASVRGVQPGGNPV